MTSKLPLDKSNYLYIYKADVIKVVDADTIDVLIDCGMSVYRKERLRLYGINAWETRGKERPKGLLAKQWLIDQIDGKEITINTIKDRSGKYGRLLADIYLGNRNLNNELVELGHARFQKY